MVVMLACQNWADIKNRPAGRRLRFAVAPQTITSIMYIHILRFVALDTWRSRQEVSITFSIPRSWGNILKIKDSAGSPSASLLVLYR
jgi:hypothetical protein